MVAGLPAMWGREDLLFPLRVHPDCGHCRDTFFPDRSRARHSSKDRSAVVDPVVLTVPAPEDSKGL